MKLIQTSKAPAPLGHYSQAISHNGIVYVSGQLPLDPASPDSVPETIEDQTRLTLDNIQAVLEAANSDKSLVLKATIYISDLGHWGQVNRVYGEFFGSHKPARAAVPTKDLPKGCLLEIEVIAATRSA